LRGGVQRRSSSIRFAVYEAGDTLRRRLDGKIDRIGVSDMTFVVVADARASSHAG
jgi:hypothetical protein